MSYDDENPYCRVFCQLTRDGIIDAVKHQIPVQGSTATLWINSAHPLWEELFALDPEPMRSDDDDSVDQVQLPIGRQRQAVVLPDQPQIVELFSESPIEVWMRPRIATKYGPARSLDFCSGIDGLFEYEAKLIENFQPVVLAAREALDLKVSEWRTWVGTDGIANARILSDRVDEMLAASLQLSIGGLYGPLRSLVNRLRPCLEQVTNGDNDSLSLLMETVREVELSLSEYQDRINREQDKATALEEATEWVRGSGSSRLIKALDAGLLKDSMGVYRDERLRLERPGWKWLVEKDQPIKPIVNPNEEDLDALIEAREIDSSCSLCFAPAAGPLLMTSFLDRTIIKPTTFDWESN